MASTGKFKRIFCIVMDSLGIGEEPDAAAYNDVGSDTLGHISERMDSFVIPNLQKIGMANLKKLKQVPPAEKPLGYYAVLREKSVGKDTMTGHWEMMGLHTTKPFVTFTDTGFPPELIAELEKRTGHKVIGNKSASGTAILDELAEEEIATGHMIVYTSADSVFQIAANEADIPVEELYRYCAIAREMLTGDLAVGRVIARPYVGDSPENFVRTANRHDYAISPFAPTLLDELKGAGKDVIGVGKINDIFNGQGITEFVRTKDNADGLLKTSGYQEKDFDGLCFVNLVETDSVYGHRRHIDGYADAVSAFDRWLTDFMPGMRQDDMLIISADHGCDPGYPAHTDHTREYVEFLMKTSCR